jgi:hypothetical protein
VRDMFLPGLVVVVWVASWWGPRRFRLWFALLSPFGSVAAIVFAFMSVPRASCDHGCVLGWASSVDSSHAVASTLLTFPVTLAIAPITGIVELVLFVRRNPPGPEPASMWDDPETGSPETEDPSWSDLTRGPRRD